MGRESKRRIRLIEAAARPGRSTSTVTTAITYGTGEKFFQDQLGSSLSACLDATNRGTLTPGVQAQKNAAADQINKTSGGLLDRVNSFLAARGFGKSGTTGKASLTSELGRESALGANDANFAQVQQTQNSSNLMAALQYAFQQLGPDAERKRIGDAVQAAVPAGISAANVTRPALPACQGAKPT